MEMYSYLMDLVKGAAEAAHRVQGLQDGHLVMVYDHLMILLEDANRDNYITNYQWKLLVAYLDRVWGGGEDSDNGC